MLCADAATGRIAWSCRIEDAVFASPAVDVQRVYFGARDGRCSCLDRRNGQRLWQVEMGSPIVTRPALVIQPALSSRRLYVVASGGQVCCLDAGSGRAVWTFDVAAHTQTRPQLLSSPVVLGDGDNTGLHNLLFFGTELRNGVNSTAVLYCLRD